MPTSPQLPQPPADPERPGTVLETDEDIRRALQSNKPSKPTAKGVAAPKTSPPASSARPYRPTLRPPIAMLTVSDDGKSEGQERPRSSPRQPGERRACFAWAGTVPLPGRGSPATQREALTGSTLGKKCRARVLTQSPPSFFTKLFNKRVNTRRERERSRSVTLGPRTGRELFSAMEAKSP
jgi:hypothetical protein